MHHNQNNTQPNKRIDNTTIKNNYFITEEEQKQKQKQKNILKKRRQRQQLWQEKGWTGRRDLRKKTLNATVKQQAK